MDADCIKLTSYFGERRRGNGGLAGDALIGLYASRQIAASISCAASKGSG